MNLLERLPDFYRNSPESVDILEAVAGCLQDLKKRADSLLNQMQVSTAAWGLDIWEEMYNIPADISKSESERRAVILSRMRTTGSITPEVVRKVAGAFSDRAVKVTETPGEYAFHIEVAWYESTSYEKLDFMKAIEEIKPAHLAWNHTIVIISQSQQAAAYAFAVHGGESITDGLPVFVS